MKQLLLCAITTALLSSCAFPAYDNLYYTDFTRYTDENFFVSSVTAYTGNPYVALGDITIEHYPGSGRAYQEPSNTQDMLDRLVQAAKNVGANGIIGYSCHMTTADKYNPTKWSASGIAVHFANLPNMPIKQATNENIKNEFAQTTSPKDITKFTKQTVDYLIENDIKFIIWSVVHGDQYFDLNLKKHIPQQEFDIKYGVDAGYTIDIMYKDARKAQRKVSKAN